MAEGLGLGRTPPELVEALGAFAAPHAADLLASSDPLVRRAALPGLLARPGMATATALLGLGDHEARRAGLRMLAAMQPAEAFLARDLVAASVSDGDMRVR